MKKILLLTLLFTSVSSFAAPINDVDKWYADKAARDQAARQEYAKSVYGKDLTSFTDNVKSVGGNVSASSNVASTIANGSRVTAASTISKAADYAKVGAQMAGRYGKGVLRGTPSAIVGGLAVQGILDAVGWVMKDGAVVKPLDNQNITCKSDGSDCTNSQKLYRVDSYDGNQTSVGTFYTLDSATSLCTSLHQTTNNYSTTYSTSAITKDSGNGRYYCLATMTAGNKGYVLSFETYSNPSYSPNSQASTSTTPVSQDELAKKIADEVQKKIAANPNDATANQVIQAAYTPDQSVGMTLSDDTVNGLANAIGKSVADNIQAAAKTADGKSTATTPDGGTVYTFIDSDQSTDALGISTGTTTTTNPDGTTTTSTNTSTSTNSFPAFCGWASIVCDWIGWTKEQPELKDEPLQIQDADPTQFQQKDYIKFAASCPFTSEQVSLDLGVGVINFQKDLTFFCTVGEQARPYIQGTGYLGSLIFLLFGIRNRNA